MDPKDRPASAPPPPYEDLSGSIRRVESRELLGERGELIIVHNGRDYRLRLTQNGKLILTA